MQQIADGDADPDKPPILTTQRRNNTDAKIALSHDQVIVYVGEQYPEPLLTDQLPLLIASDLFYLFRHMNDIPRPVQHEISPGQKHVIKLQRITPRYL